MKEMQIYDNRSEISFEDFKNQNGIIFWWASELMLMLGYDDMKKFQKVIDRAIKAFISLGIDHYDNIEIVDRVDADGKQCRDFKLTRFACYLVAMNGDPKKHEVARMQAYFAEQTRNFEIYVQAPNDMERILYREEIRDGNKTLSTTAHKAGVVDFAMFNNAGYRGMYNMLNVNLAKRRGVDSNKLLETMGRTELAANLFRITQTEERIKTRNIRGQKNLENTHYSVGRDVRKMVVENTGLAPEQLPQERTIISIKKDLKVGSKKMAKIDKPKK